MRKVFRGTPVPCRKSPVSAHTSFAFLFAGLLAVSSVILLFVPLLKHAWVFATTRTGFLLVVGPIVALSFGAIALVALALSDPVYFLPVVAITVTLRVASPTLLYRRIRDALEGRRSWIVLRYLLLIGFMGLSGLLVYHILAETPLGAPSLLSEQVVMALGAAVILVRLALRARPKDRAALWPLWLSAILFAMAFVVVAPYAFPGFTILYAGSGISGWILGAAVIWYERQRPAEIVEEEYVD